MIQSRDILAQHIDLRRRVRTLETESREGSQSDALKTAHLDPVTEHLLIPTTVNGAGGWRPGRVGNLLWEIEQESARQYTSEDDSPPYALMGEIRQAIGVIPGVGQLKKLLSHAPAGGIVPGVINSWDSTSDYFGYRESRNRASEGPVRWVPLGEFIYPIKLPLHPETAHIEDRSFQGKIPKIGKALAGNRGGVNLRFGGYPHPQLAPIGTNHFVVIRQNDPSLAVYFGNQRGPAYHYTYTAEGVKLLEVTKQVEKIEVSRSQGYTVIDAPGVFDSVSIHDDFYDEETGPVQLSRLEVEVKYVGSPIHRPLPTDDATYAAYPIAPLRRYTSIGWDEVMAGWGEGTTIPEFVAPTFAAAQSQVDRALKDYVVRYGDDPTAPIHKLVRWYKRTLAQVDSYENWSAPTFNYGGWSTHSIYDEAPSNVASLYGAQSAAVSGWAQKDDPQARPAPYTHNGWTQVVLGAPKAAGSSKYVYNIEACLRHGWCHLRGTVQLPFDYDLNGLTVRRTGQSDMGRLPLPYRKGLVDLIEIPTVNVVNHTTSHIRILEDGYVEGVSDGTHNFSVSYPVDPLAPGEV